MIGWGELYVFEGPDGVGKTTLAEALTQHLNSTGRACDYLAFPGREAGTLGLHVYELHHATERFGIESLSPTSLQMLHVAAHVDTIEKRILPSLRDGKSIVLDRFWWSTWVYGIARGVSRSVLEAMLDVEIKYWGKVVPTAAFLIRRSSPLREDDPIDFWKMVRGNYDVLAERERVKYPTWVVDNDGAVDDALKTVVATIEEVRQKSGTSRRSRQASRRAGFLQSEVKGQLSLDLPGAQTGPRPAGLTIFSSLSPAKPTEVYDTYWRFATERQAIFFRRFANEPPPWTNDPILARHKFTNAYRASDRVSQYLVQRVIYEGDPTADEVFFRILLFKIFNRIETWELLLSALGGIAYRDYSFEKYDQVLAQAREAGEPIFSAAYIMPSGASSFGFSVKHRSYLKLLERMMEDGVPRRLTEARSMRHAFELLRSYPMLGDFLAYQYVIDINYSPITNFSEMEFVVPGPGARDGIRKCFTDLGGLNEVDVIRLVTDRQQQEFARLELPFQSLFGRPLQLIDCQNLFCEVDKYARLAHPDIKGRSERKRIKQVYRWRSQPLTYWYPPKWGLNDLLSARRRVHDSRL
ncbi:MAG: putative DNA base hypermodification protein [Anaerolineae bacterium]